MGKQNGKMLSNPCQLWISYISDKNKKWENDGKNGKVDGVFGKMKKKWESWELLSFRN